MSDSIIKVVDGDEFTEGKCQFCENNATTVFGVVNLQKKRYNGDVFKGFRVCSKHLRALNSLLDGTKDIDTLVKNYDKIRSKEMKVEDIMDEPFPAISEDTHISLIRDILKTYSAVILTKKGKPTGIISKADLLKKL